ncbi:hypothetical protein Ait01nite_023550 [Actinoplanes italicus]|uniref:Regulator of Chromosome Condensation (RCC1) repeat protein n=1 Tax=Actinoplanes italicus TaxID=113567 RepID=A0A2T0KGF6_9ACTN|nr:RCC1 domain-containing protein [Actinoplanes italicus]PRX22268.1 Regulator of Chromosome Condensation (RCC1) repeat protein [Actinoplanes italicus]GIE29310.1 hypothetical protein Ait01nite_023550 [Actinoplanes italicus]
MPATCDNVRRGSRCAVLLLAVLTLVAPARAEAAVSWSLVAAGPVSVCALRGDRTLWCWGGNEYGQVGDGTTVDRNEPVQVAGGGRWRAVTVGSRHTCGLRTDGSLWCWGDDTSGTPATVVPGDGHACGVRTDGTLWCRGENGAGHACGVRTGGTLWCRGENGAGQIGDGGTRDVTEPVRVHADLTWKAVATGSGFTCALTVAGALWCWGDDSSGQLGDGTRTTHLFSDVPLRVGIGTGWDRVVPAGDHTCAWRTDGSRRCWGGEPLRQPAGTCTVGPGRGLWCWGSNRQGQVGNGDTRNVPEPVRVGRAATWTSVSTGDEFACGRRTDASLWCWGDNFHGQLGDGSLIERHAPVRVAGSWLSVGTGTSHACGIRTDRSLWCWGDNEHMQLGVATVTRRPVPVPPA